MLEIWFLICFLWEEAYSETDPLNYGRTYVPHPPPPHPLTTAFAK